MLSLIMLVSSAFAYERVVLKPGECWSGQFHYGAVAQVCAEQSVLTPDPDNFVLCRFDQSGEMNEILHRIKSWNMYRVSVTSGRKLEILLSNFGSEHERCSAEAQRLQPMKRQ